MMGGEIPLMDGASIVKESLFQGSGRIELEVGASLEEVARFYSQAMEQKGWPSGRAMFVGNQSVLMLDKQGDKFLLKAESKNGRTRVIIVLIRTTKAPTATGPLPSTGAAAPKGASSAPQSETIPQNSGMTIEGAPPAKGSLVQRIVVPPSQGQGRYAEKDPSPDPEDPSPDPEDPSSDPEDPSSDPEDPSSSSSFDSEAEMPKMLSVNLRVMVRWDVTVPEYYQYKGSITLQINGTMKRIELTYEPEVMTVSYNYDERKTNLAPIPKEHCQDSLVYEYQGGGVSQIDDSAGLKIQRFSAMAAPYLKNLSADKQQFLAAMQGSMTIPDYYDFYVGGPGRKKTIPGRKRDQSKPKDCTYLPIKKTMSGFTVGVQMKFPESGAMSGTRTWSADDQGLCPPSLGIHVSDIAPLLKKSPLKPPEGGNKNVTYTVSWMIEPTHGDATEFESDEEKKKKPCRLAKQKILQIKVIRKLYENPNIRRYADENYPAEERRGHYQNAIENIFSDIMKDTQPSDWNNFDAVGSMIDTLTDDQISDAYRSIYRENGGTKTLMEAGCSVSKTDPCDIRDLGISMNIHGGRNVKIVDFGGVSSAQSFDEVDVLKTGYFDAARASYAADYFDCQEAGEAFFEAALAHEMTHCRQYVENCFPQSVEEMAQYEREAYKVEMEKLMEFLEKWDC
ncbi:MAG: hypothetical protein HGJ94_11230 [Desulfosarcina sp.]|nr:hypothetical protein [Desulfosarcina sp.]MBC2744875.1 hypothetical protein [Desulfosarcina sp.]MBC2767783.1 hypothetical protein [Desulfosarcina sp.]